MADAREIAVRTLVACEKQGAWSEGYLKRAIHRGGLERRDAALATRLCFGVLQNRILLDWYLSRLSHLPLEKLEPYVHANLRVALYQICFLDKIPPSAAVHEAVRLTRMQVRHPRAAGMVNGILRTYLRTKEELTLPTDWDMVHQMSVQYSHPRWLVEKFLNRLGPQQTECLLRENNGQPPITIQANTVVGTVEELLAALTADGVRAEPHPFLDNCLQLFEAGNLERLRAYEQGMFFVQDGAARLSVCAMELKPGQRVLDCCAAPGGKSFAAAVDMGNRGAVLSCDIHPHKLPLITAGRERLKLSIVSPTRQDATRHRAEWVAQFDAVLCDVPCSGLGIIRKKPEIRYKNPQEMEELPHIQRKIIAQGCQYVKPGGTLLYSTCTVMEEENEQVIADFLRCHPEFKLQSRLLPGVGQMDGTITLWPHLHHTDGFFIAVMKRVR